LVSKKFIAEPNKYEIIIMPADGSDDMSGSFFQRFFI